MLHLTFEKTLYFIVGVKIVERGEPKEQCSKEDAICKGFNTRVFSFRMRHTILKNLK
jgi:hypothetical protein